MPRPYLLSALLALCLATFVVFIAALRTSSSITPLTWSVELRESGFHPQTLSVHAGDRVTFTTTLEKPFWPASDLHPTHELYPAFDPRKSVEPGASWSFVFEHPGTWKYHDHLYFLHRGTIEVLGESQGANRDRDFLGVSSCPPGTRKQECWEDAIERAFAAGGLAAAFDALAAMYDADKAFALDCHLFAHAIGKKGYELFRRQGSIDLTARSYYCNFGFFHGFMEKLLNASGNLEEARVFCDWVERTNAQQGSSVKTHCYHGVGHGVADVTLLVKSNADVMDVIKPALEFCRRVSENEFFIGQCAGGVFDALSIAYRELGNEHLVDKKDPYALCRAFTEPYFQKVCYEGDLNEIVLLAVDRDFLRAVAFAEAIPDESHARDAIRTLAHIYVDETRATFSGPSDSVSLCRALQPPFHLSCIEGVVASVFVSAKPGREYLEGLAFCASPLFMSEERSACLEHVKLYTNAVYPDKTAVISEFGVK